MSSDEARNKAVWDVTHNVPPPSMTNTDAAVKEKYEIERKHQEKLKSEKT